MLEPDQMLAIHQLVASYFQLVDRSEGRNPGALFTADGTLELGSLHLVGRNAITAFFAERERQHMADGRKTRHFFSGLAVDALGGGRAAGRLAMLVYAGHGEAPLPEMGVATIGDIDDIYVSTAEGWRFEARRAKILHAGANAAHFAKAR